MLKKILVLALCASGVFALPAGAQVNPQFADLNSEIEMVRAMARMDRRALLTQELTLSGAEAEAFWKIYGSYETDMRKVHDRLVKLITDYAARHESMDGATADKLMKDYFTFKRDVLKTREAYAKKVAKALGSPKAARWVQVEGRMDVLQDLNLASQIPLIK